MKHWRIGSEGHALQYYAYGATREAAIKQVEFALGGHNPAKLLVREIPAEQIPEDETVFGWTPPEAA